jgi:hypothetical protein
LKKIAVYSDASYLNADTEEISHMLFGDGRKMMMFSTHPPLNDRISRVDPGFQPEELDRLAATILRDELKAKKAEERLQQESSKPERSMFDAGQIMDGIGRPDWNRMLMAAAISASIPDNISQAAHSTEWAPEVLFYTLLDSDREIREQQLLVVAGKMGSDSETQVRALLEAGDLPSPEQRLPLLEMAFPALKRRPPDFVNRVLDTAKAMIDVDGRVDVFEYLLARSITMQLRESYNPQRVRVAGNKAITSCRNEALSLLAVLAGHGSNATGEAEAAFAEGVKLLGIDPKTSIPDVVDWMNVLDTALPTLDALKPGEKEKLVRAMTGVVLHDGRLDVVELELLRVSTDLLHVPLPLLNAPPKTLQQS